MGEGGRRRKEGRRRRGRERMVEEKEKRGRGQHIKQEISCFLLYRHIMIMYNVYVHACTKQTTNKPQRVTLATMKELKHTLHYNK